jgi:hypothetical protein
VGDAGPDAQLLPSTGALRELRRDVHPQEREPPSLLSLFLHLSHAPLRLTPCPQAPKASRHRYRVFLHSSTYGTLSATPPRVEDIESLLTQFNTKEIDEKFFEEDILKVRSEAPPSPPPPAAAALPLPTPPRPKPPAAPAKPKYSVAFEYNPSVTEEGMMAIFVGDVLEITEQSDPDWWMALNVSSGQSGWVPAAYVRQA